MSQTTDVVTLSHEASVVPTTNSVHLTSVRLRLARPRNGDLDF